jgi:hypothetical protein
MESIESNEHESIRKVLKVKTIGLKYEDANITSVNLQRGWVRITHASSNHILYSNSKNCTKSQILSRQGTITMFNFIESSRNKNIQLYQGPHYEQKEFSSSLVHQKHHPTLHKSFYTFLSLGKNSLTNEYFVLRM